MDCSRPGFPVHHHLPELVQTHVHQVGDASSGCKCINTQAPVQGERDDSPSQNQSADWMKDENWIPNRITPHIILVYELQYFWNDQILDTKDRLVWQEYRDGRGGVRCYKKVTENRFGNFKSNSLLTWSCWASHLWWWIHQSTQVIKLYRMENTYTHIQRNEYKLRKSE